MRSLEDIFGTTTGTTSTVSEPVKTGTKSLVDIFGFTPSVKAEPEVDVEPIMQQPTTTGTTTPEPPVELSTIAPLSADKLGLKPQSATTDATATITDPLLKEKYKAVAEAESPVEAGLKQAVGSAVFSDDAMMQARREAHPVAATVGEVGETLASTVAGGVGALKLALKVPKLAQIAKASKIGKSVVSGLALASSQAMDYTARNNELLASSDPEVAEEAKKNLAINVASSLAGSTLAAYIKPNLVQTAAQAVADVAIETAGQAATGDNAFDKEHRLNTIISGAANGIFGLIDIKGIDTATGKTATYLKKIGQNKLPNEVRATPEQLKAAEEMASQIEGVTFKKDYPGFEKGDVKQEPLLMFNDEVTGTTKTIKAGEGVDVLKAKVDEARASQKPEPGKAVIQSEPEMQGKTKAALKPIEEVEAGAKEVADLPKVETDRAALPEEVAPPATSEQLPVRKKGFLSESGGTAKEQEGFSSDDPTEMALIKSAESKFDAQDEDVRKKFVPTIKERIRNAIDATGAALIDRSYYAKRLLGKDGDKVIAKFNAVKGNSAEAKAQYADEESAVSKNLPHHLEKKLPRYLQAKRIIEIEGYKGEGVVKQVKGMTLDEARAIVNSVESRTDASSNAVKASAQRFWDAMGNQLKQLHDEGLISKESYDNLREKGKYYMPREYIQHIDPEASQGMGRKVSVSESGIKALKEGSEEAMINNWRLLLAENVARTQGRIAKNRAAKELFKFVKDSPENKVGARIDENIDAELPTGMERIYYVEDGQKQAVLVPTKFAKSWNQNDEMVNRQLAQGLNLAFGGFMVRPMATGVLAPEFALSNIFRDASMQWLTTREYNKFAPVAIAQTLRNWAKVSRDAWTGRGRYRDYVKEGGGMDYLNEQGAMLRDPTKIVTANKERTRTIVDAFNKLQQFSERLGRLALREQAIINGKTPEEATRIAREYLDFSQGGSWTKAIDNAVPYLNASIQGTRGLVRSFIKNPVDTGIKAAQLMAMGAATAYMANQYRKDSWEEIGDREKVSRWNFPLPWKYKNEDGKEIKSYISIPKDQSARLFAAIGETWVDRELGNINGGMAWRRIKMALGDINPVDFIGFVPPTLSAIVGYALNKDFWTQDDIWKGRNVSPNMEFYPGKTERHFIDFAENMKKVGVEVSPARLESSMRQVMPANIITAMMGGAYDQVASSLDGEEKAKLDKKTLKMFASVPGIRKFLRTTYPSKVDDDELNKKIEKYKIEIKDEKGRTKNKRLLQNEIYQKELDINDLRQANDNKLLIISGLLKAGDRELVKKKIKELSEDARKTLGEDEIKRLNERLEKNLKKQ